jgi:hypothetical protein
MRATAVALDGDTGEVRAGQSRRRTGHTTRAQKTGLAPRRPGRFAETPFNYWPKQQVS